MDSNTERVVYFTELENLRNQCRIDYTNVTEFIYWDKIPDELQSLLLDGEIYTLKNLKNTYGFYGYQEFYKVIYNEDGNISILFKQDVSKIPCKNWYCEDKECPFKCDGRNDTALCQKQGEHSRKSCYKRPHLINMKLGKECANGIFCPDIHCPHTHGIYGKQPVGLKSTCMYGGKCTKDECPYIHENDEEKSSLIIQEDFPELDSEDKTYSSWADMPIDDDKSSSWNIQQPIKIKEDNKTSLLNLCDEHIHTLVCPYNMECPTIEICRKTKIHVDYCRDFNLGICSKVLKCGKYHNIVCPKGKECPFLLI